MTNVRDYYVSQRAEQAHTLLCVGTGVFSKDQSAKGREGEIKCLSKGDSTGSLSSASDVGVQRCMQFLEVAGFRCPKTLALEVIDSPTGNQGPMPSISFPLNTISTRIDL